jgi:hypothetical protein
VVAESFFECSKRWLSGAATGGNYLLSGLVREMKF